MSLPVALVVLFIIGLFYDVLWTIYIRAVSSKRRMLASVMAGLLTGFGFAAWAIMVKTGVESSIAGITAYSLGGSIGTYLSFKPHDEKPTCSHEPSGGKPS